MKPPVYTMFEFRVLESELSAARARMRKAERTARQEPGCLQFHFLQDVDHPTDFAGYGMWATKADMESHMAKIKESKEDQISLATMLDPSHPTVRRVMDRV